MRIFLDKLVGVFYNRRITSEKTNFVVVSDFRLHMLLAACDLRRKADGKCYLIISRRFLYHADYGQRYFPLNSFNYKIFLCFVLRIKIVKELSFINDGDETGVMSSLYSITNDSNATEKKYPLIYQDLINLDFGAKEISKFISEREVENVFIFNGRLAGSYSLCKVLKQRKYSIKFYEHSRCLGRRQYLRYLLTDYPIHDFSAWGFEYIKAFESAKRDIGKISEYSKNKLQNKFSAIYDAEPSIDYDISIFLSSSHEFKSLDKEILKKNFDNELQFVQAVVKDYPATQKIAVRAHPNQRNDVSWEYSLKDLKAYCKENKIDFYSPDSNISSHGLIDRSSLIVVDISSIGIDAIIKNKPVKIYGCPDYMPVYKWVLDRYIDPKDTLKIFLSVMSMSTQVNNQKMNYDLVAINCIAIFTLKLRTWICCLLKK